MNSAPNRALLIAAFVLLALAAWAAVSTSDISAASARRQAVVTSRQALDVARAELKKAISKSQTKPPRKRIAGAELAFGTFLNAVDAVRAEIRERMEQIFAALYPSRELNTAAVPSIELLKRDPEKGKLIEEMEELDAQLQALGKEEEEFQLLVGNSDFNIASPDTTITTFPRNSSIQHFGFPNTASYGQVVTVPTNGDSVLTSFTFEMCQPNTINFRGYVFAWDGSKAAGSALFISSLMNTGSTVCEQVTFNTGGIPLTAGQQYVLFASISQDCSGSGQGQWGARNDNPYSGGSFVYLNNGCDPAAWTSSGWSSFTIFDLAFSASFVAPCVITCPNNITVSNDADQCGAVVNYPLPTSTGDCGIITCNPPSGSIFPVGTTPVTCSAAAMALVAGCSTITESTSQAIVALNSVSCNNGIGHTDNSYWRAFDLPSFGILNAFDVQSVDIGVELASSGGAGSRGEPSISPRLSGAGKTAEPGTTAPNGTGQPLTVNLYTSSQPFPTGFPGSLTLIGTTSTTVGDQALTIVNVPVTGTAGAGAELVVEVFTPDGRAAGNLFFIGSNGAPETGPSYLSAADCGVPTPTPTGAIVSPPMNIVLNVTGCEQAGSACTFTVTVNDTQPPTITCPAPVTAVAAQTCPLSSSATVTFPAPTVSDNCPGVTSVCNPPSGSIFPVGTTTVTCTATDASGNTATCTFTVTVFSGCLQDDSNPANVVLFNAATGEYRFCCNGTVFTGVGTVIVKGCIVTIQHYPADRRVLIKFDGAVRVGTASLQSPPGSIKCTITDRNTRNNTCACQVSVGQSM